MRWPALFRLCSLKWFVAVSADYVYFSGSPDNSTADRAYIFDASVNGFLTSAFGGAVYRQAARIQGIFAKVGGYPCLRLWG